MGFKRRKKYDYKKKRYDNRNNQNRKKDRFHPKRAIAGAILLLSGLYLIFSSLDPQWLPSRLSFNLPLIGGMASFVVGALLLLLSPNRKGQAKISRGIDKIGGGIGNALAKSMEGCKCCRCTNCGRDHNHWTHVRDPDDFWD